MPAIRAKDNLKLQLDTAAAGATPVWADVPGLKSIAGGGVKTDRVDVTAFDSPGVSKEYMPGLADPQPLTFELNYRPGDPVQQALRAANLAGAAVTLRLLLSMTNLATQEAATFGALVTGFGAPVGTPDKELVVACEVTPVTAPIFAAAAA